MAHPCCASSQPSQLHRHHIRAQTSQFGRDTAVIGRGQRHGRAERQSQRATAHCQLAPHCAPRLLGRPARLWEPHWCRQQFARHLKPGGLSGLHQVAALQPPWMPAKLRASMSTNTTSGAAAAAACDKAVSYTTRCSADNAPTSQNAPTSTRAIAAQIHPSHRPVFGLRSDVCLATCNLRVNL